MADRPIIFSGSRIGALLDGRKTQTRRLAWRKREIFEPGADDTERVVYQNGRAFALRPTIWQKVHPGDRLWVRESFVRCETDKGPTNNVVFRVDSKDLKGDYWSEIAIDPNGVKWHSSIHMPRWASRLTLVVTATKIERVQEISGSDVEAEGASNCVDDPMWFPCLWDSLHGKGSWDANPEVVALTFEVHHRNIDAMERAGG